MSEEDKGVEIVTKSISCCAQEIQSQLQPMLKVPLILSLLHAIVIYCKDEGKDPTKHLCARDLLDQIANVSKLQQCESSTKVMTQLKIVRITILITLDLLEYVLENCVHFCACACRPT